MLVDLSTTEKDLESLMLSEYPGRLREKQIVKSGEGASKVYSFLRIDYGKLTIFLLKNPSHGFKIIDSSTRRVIENSHNFFNNGYCH